MLNKYDTTPLLIFSQSDYLIHVVDTNSHLLWKTVQIQISWLLQRYGITGQSGLVLNLLDKDSYSLMYILQILMSVLISSNHVRMTENVSTKMATTSVTVQAGGPGKIVKLVSYHPAIPLLVLCLTFNKIQAIKDKPVFKFIAIWSYTEGHNSIPVFCALRMYRLVWAHELSIGCLHISEGRFCHLY